MSQASKPYLEQLFNDFNNKKVVVLGDVMIDAYLWGKVERISPEAPVPIVGVSKKDFRLGGAANVAKNLRVLGAVPMLFSVIGKGAQGELFKKILQEADIDTKYLVHSENRPTTIKTRVIAGHQHILRIDEEITEELDQQERKDLLECLKASIAEADIIIIEDYDKGVLNKWMIQKVLELAKKESKQVVVDPKRKNFLLYKGVTMMKPNLKELREGLKLDLPKSFSLPSVQKAAQILRDKLSLEVAFITLSENGIYMGSNKEQHHVKAHLRDIYDVSGAGDTVISIASLLMACKAPMSLVAEIANLGGGLVCEKVGVVPVEKEKLLQESIRVLC